jgi:hypothetical protein
MSKQPPRILSLPEHFALANEMVLVLQLACKIERACEEIYKPGEPPREHAKNAVLQLCALQRRLHNAYLEACGDGREYRRDVYYKAPAKRARIVFE